MSRPTDAEALAALGVVRAWLEPALSPPVETQRYADLRQFGSGIYRRALEAIRKGELRAYEPARRKLLVLQADFTSWLECAGHRVQPSSEPPPVLEADVIAEIVSINRRRRRLAVGGGR